MSSPMWNKPSDLMKKRLVRKRLSVNNSQDTEKPSPKQTQPPKKSSVTKKRKNPFGCSPSLPKKKTHTEVAGSADAHSCEQPTLFNALDGSLPSDVQSKVKLVK